MPTYHSDWKKQRMEINLHFNINLTKKQREVYELFHKKEVKEIVMNFSRQSGKTTLAEILLIETMVKKKCNCAYISPSYAQGKKVYREIIQLLGQTKLITKKNSTDLTVELVNGSYLQFFTAQSPTAIRGNTISGLLVLDEAAYLPEETSDGQHFYSMVVQPVTKAKKPKILFNSTPNGKQGLFYEKYLEGLNSDTVKSVKCTIYDDTTVSKEDIEELKNSTPPLSWQQEFLCEFLDSAITVFEGFERQFIDYQKVIFKNKVWIGVDLSANGEDETILTRTDGEHVMQIVIKGSLDTKYKIISNIINNESNLVMAYCEANGIGEPMINEIRKLVKRKSKVLYFTTTNENKSEMVGSLQLDISQDKIHFDKEDTELYKQMGVFTYKVNKQTRRITYAAKEPYHDDRIMSLLISLRAKEDYPIKNIETNYKFIPTRKNRI